MANIVYSDGSEPGITRRKIRDKWGYFDAAGERITERDEIDRLNAIGLPPAYRDAWFCPDPNGHIQAVGWDEKGRKQYRYHTEFRAAQEAAKYEGCSGFGAKLPLLRKQVEKDLRHPGLSRARAVAAVVRLLDIARVRVGNEAYAQANKSFGATTLRKRHAELKGSTLRLQFKAKSGKLRQLTITDKSLSRFVKRVNDLPGQHLFRWVDKAGETHPVTSSDVNEYIKAAMKDDYTAKHFRTWGASVIAFETIVCAEHDIGLKTLLEPVVAALGNTPAIARKSYVHPSLIELVKTGDQAQLRAVKLPRSLPYLTRYERGLLAWLDGGSGAQALAA
ncbi:DNA topoisomerase-1 [Sphingomonas guangdongensis]|uniref:DNA topoisomerase n=1 Tax=Sphingomonas guangdongensis TaxID=1141890 RepID=A0A285QA33_9SPHN|nr:DNA topoisomerase-1 [Sphingomonas guangdongensis]